MDLEALRALILVGEAGSLHGAAKRMGWSRSTLTRRLEALAADLGGPLLVTARDGATLTAAGRLTAERGVDLLRQAADLRGHVAGQLSDAPRVLTVRIPPGLPPLGVSAGVRHLRERFPDVHLRVHVGAEAGAEPDLVLRWGRPDAGPWIAFQLFPMTVGLKASAAYLARQGTPRSLADLEGHALMAWPPGLAGPSALPLRDGGQHEVRAVATVTDPHLLHTFVAQGLCLALVPDSPFEQLQPGEVRVLPNRVGARSGLWVMVPESTARVPWIRALFDELRASVEALNHLHPEDSP
ncbi:MAG: LysR family transcriptional regulator [Alphaproteobacteria bacterium]|nr:LysR family transcriptional regulator [Alphaproteobacteria bacterium]